MNPIFVNINVYKWNSYSAFECFCDLEVRKFLIVHIYRNRKIPYLSLLVYIAGCGNLLFVLMGAQWEWTRLLTPSVPLFLLMFAQAVNSLKVRVVIRRNERFQLG